jgi:type I restriction enzyme S subunit
MLTHRNTTILGDIPGEWKRSLLRDLLDMPQCAAGDWGDDSGEVALRVLRSTNITNDGQLTLGDVAVRYFPSRKVGELGLMADDILLERSGGGPDQPVGRVVLLRSALDGYGYGNFIHRLRTKKGAVEPRFLYYCLFELHRSGVIERLQFQTTQMRNLDYRDYLRIYIPCPPPDEQRRIADLIDASDGLIQASKTLLGISASLHRDQMRGPANRLKVAMLRQLLSGRVRLPAPVEA